MVKVMISKCNEQTVCNRQIVLVMLKLIDVSVPSSFAATTRNEIQPTTLLDLLTVNMRANDISPKNRGFDKK
jgi:hypothetical protein